MRSVVDMAIIPAQVFGVKLGIPANPRVDNRIADHYNKSMKYGGDAMLYEALIPITAIRAADCHWPVPTYTLGTLLLIEQSTS